MENECTLGGPSCTSVGLESFNAVAATNKPINRTSLGDKGRHGASNTWARWSGRSVKNAGIASRAPYGPPQVSKKRQKLQQATLGGTSNHHKGLGIGPHGHAIGVIPAAIGGAHGTVKTNVTIAKPTQTSPGLGVNAAPSTQSGPTAQPHTTFCSTCFGTWAAVFVVVLVGMSLSGR
jgi:hypothetical protein